MHLRGNGILQNSNHKPSSNAIFCFFEAHDVLVEKKKTLINFSSFLESFTKMGVCPSSLETRRNEIKPLINHEQRKHNFQSKDHVKVLLLGKTTHFNS